KSQHQPGAKVEPDRRTTAPDSRAHAVFSRRRHQPRRPAPAKIRPGKPAPIFEKGTAATSPCEIWIDTTFCALNVSNDGIITKSVWGDCVIRYSVVKSIKLKCISNSVQDS